jgi:hypothetical protein
MGTSANHRVALLSLFEMPVFKTVGVLPGVKDILRAVRCREMFNYMIYLLFVEPEMSLPQKVFSAMHGNLLMRC